MTTTRLLALGFSLVTGALFLPACSGDDTGADGDDDDGATDDDEGDTADEEDDGESDNGETGDDAEDGSGSEDAGSDDSGSDGAGGLGDPCTTEEECMEQLYCAEVVPGLPSYCSECTQDGDCTGGELCSPTFDATSFTGYLDCVAAGSVANGSPCDHDGSGDEACASGHCAATTVGGLTFGVCGECEVDTDCSEGEVCTPGAMGTTCEPDTGDSGTDDSGTDDSGTDDSGTDDTGTDDTGTDDSGTDTGTDDTGSDTDTDTM